MEQKTTCQICERVIKSNTGVIAHHGYTRPDRGSGWQTASCWGARHLHYEKYCDQIQPCIDFINAFITRQKEWVRDFMKNPPETITDIPWIGAKERVFTRPEAFNTVTSMEKGSHSYNSYDHEFCSKVSKARRQIADSTRDVKRLTERLANWKLQ